MQMQQGACDGESGGPLGLTTVRADTAWIARGPAWIARGPAWIARGPTWIARCQAGGSLVSRVSRRVAHVCANGPRWRWRPEVTARGRVAHARCLRGRHNWDARLPGCRAGGSTTSGCKAGRRQGGSMGVWHARAVPPCAHGCALGRSRYSAQAPAAVRVYARATWRSVPRGFDRLT